MSDNTYPYNYMYLSVVTESADVQITTNKQLRALRSVAQCKVVVHKIGASKDDPFKDYACFGIETSYKDIADIQALLMKRLNLEGTPYLTRWHDTEPMAMHQRAMRKFYEQPNITLNGKRISL